MKWSRNVVDQAVASSSVKIKFNSHKTRFQADVRVALENDAKKKELPSSKRL